MITSRRYFLGSATLAAGAVAVSQPLGAQQAGRVRGAPFGLVKDIPADQTRYTPDQFPAPFTDLEYGGRMKRCQEAMAKAKIDLLWTNWPDAMLYLHGYEITWYTPSRNPRTGTALHVDHDKLIFLDGENEVFSAAKDRRPLRGRTERETAQSLVAVLKDEGWLKPGTVVGLELRRYLPTPALAKELEAAFLTAGAKVVDATDIVGTVRNIKSPAELVAVEQAARIADIGLRAVAEVLKPGVTSAELYGAACYAMGKAGGEATAIPQAVQPGKPSSTHLLPSRRQIQAGESFAFDLAGVYKRYHANVDRTFICGDPSPELLRMNLAAKNGLEILEGATKPGTPVASVNKAMRDYFQSTDIWQYHNFSGGYELDASLPPDWCGDFWFTVANDGPDERLFELNMVTNYENSFRQNKTAEKYQLMAFSRDTFVYTARGARRLSVIPGDLIVVS